jgi:hypothetical protein
MIESRNSYMVSEPGTGKVGLLGGRPAQWRGTGMWSFPRISGGDSSSSRYCSECEGDHEGEGGPNCRFHEEKGWRHNGCRCLDDRRHMGEYKGDCF